MLAFFKRKILVYPTNVMMAGNNQNVILKDSSKNKSEESLKSFSGLYWASMAGIAAIMLGVIILFFAFHLHFNLNTGLHWSVELGGLGLTAAIVAYIYGRLVRRLYANLQNEVGERRKAESVLRLQRDLALVINSSNNIQSILERILDIGFLIEGVDCGGIYLADDDTGGLRLLAHRGLSPEFLASKRNYTANDPHTAMVKEGKPILSDYSQIHSLVHDEVIASEKLKAVAIIPMLAENRLVACLNLASKTRERFSEGITEFFMVVASQLTGAIERLRSEEALRQNEERFRTMSDFTYDLEYWMGADGNIVYISPSCERITGYTRAEFQANSNLPDLIVHPNDRPLLASHRIGRPDRPKCEAEYRIITRKGEIRWIAHVCVPVQSAHGRFLGRRASDRDVTERHLAEQALEQERNLFTSGPVIVFIRNNDEGKSVKYVSPNISQWGYKPEDFYNKRLQSYDIIHSEDKQRIAAEREFYIQTALARFEQEYRVIQPNGEICWIHDVTHVIRDESKAVTHFHGYLMDITERKQAEDKLRENERAFRALALENARLLEQARQDAQTKSILLQEVNHRVKNNLSSIIGLLRTEERFSKHEPEREAAERFKNMAERISGLAMAHTLLSATEWGPIPMNKLITHIIFAALRLTPHDKDAKVDIASSDILVCAKAANSLALIFNELTMNAVKHGLKNTTNLHISVSFHQNNGRLTLEFRNTGDDFPPQVLEGTSRGMGLHLVETLVRHDLDGTLDLRNDNGPVVILNLPWTLAVANNKNNEGS